MERHEQLVHVQQSTGQYTEVSESVGGGGEGVTPQSLHILSWNLYISQYTFIFTYC
jgi:hypothetical protein